MGWFETLALKEYSKFPLNNESNPPNLFIISSYILLILSFPDDQQTICAEPDGL